MTHGGQAWRSPRERRRARLAPVAAPAPGDAVYDGIRLGVGRVDMRRIAAAASAIALAVVAGCAGGDVASKAGGDGGPTVLRIGVAEPQGTVGAHQVEAYVTLVEERSGGDLRLDPVFEADGRGGSSEAVVDDWDQVVARRVVDGDLDLAVVPARAWDTEGVETLRALNAPLLVTSDDTVERIVTSDLADDLLGGLEEVDVTGLALLPEDMRHLFVFDGRTVADVAGHIVRVPHSDTVYAFFEALDAEPDDVPVTDVELGRMIDRGDVVGTEASFTGIVRLPRAATGIGNITLFPKLNTLVVNDAALGGLSDEQRSILENAADDLVRSSLDKHVTDDEAARRFCDWGGTVVDASPDDIATIERAARSVHETLRDATPTRALIDRLVELSGHATSVDGVPGCAPATVSETTAAGGDVAANVASEFPEGVYRMQMPLQVLLDAGLPESLAAEHDGLWTVHFENGQVLDPTCPESTYAVADGRLTITLGEMGSGCGSAAGKVLFSATWTLEGDQLQFADVRSGHGGDLLIATLFGALPFTKIR